MIIDLLRGTHARDVLSKKMMLIEAQFDAVSS